MRFQQQYRSPVLFQSDYENVIGMKQSDSFENPLNSCLIDTFFYSADQAKTRVQRQYRERVFRKQPPKPAQRRREHRGKHHHRASGKTAYIIQRNVVPYIYAVCINAAVKNSAEQRNRGAAGDAGARCKHKTGGGT